MQIPVISDQPELLVDIGRVPRPHYPVRRSGTALQRKLDRRLRRWLGSNSDVCLAPGGRYGDCTDACYVHFEYRTLLSIAVELLSPYSIENGVAEAGRRAGLLSEPGRGFFQDLLLLAKHAHLAAETSELLPSPPSSGRLCGCLHPARPAEPSSRSTAPSARTPAIATRASAPHAPGRTICCRYSGEYGGRLLGIVIPSPKCEGVYETGSTPY